MKLASRQASIEPRVAAMAAIQADVPSPRRATRTLQGEGNGVMFKIHNSHRNIGHMKARKITPGSFGRVPLVMSSCSSSFQATCDANERDGNHWVHQVMLIRMMKTISLAALTGTCFGLALHSPSSGYGMFASLAFAVPAMSAEAMTTAFRSAWAGLAAGCLHTLAGADHLAALTPLTIGQSHLRASMLGALWGFGHSTGQLMLGLLMVILKDRFQQLVPALSKWGGTTVGLTLLAIGALGVYESFFEGDHHHEHGAPHTEKSSPKEKKGFGLATFATGIVYGLQPDALFVIIPALALPTKLAAIAYILMFVLGTVTAMGAYAGVIGATSQAIKKTNTRLTANLSGAASAMAIVIGFGVLLSGWGINTPLAIA